MNNETNVYEEWSTLRRNPFTSGTKAFTVAKDPGERELTAKEIKKLLDSVITREKIAWGTLIRDPGKVRMKADGIAGLKTVRPKAESAKIDLESYGSALDYLATQAARNALDTIECAKESGTLPDSATNPQWGSW